MLQRQLSIQRYSSCCNTHTNSTHGWNMPEQLQERREIFFRSSGENTLQCSAHTKGAKLYVFQIYPMEKFFLPKGGYGPIASPKYATVISMIFMPSSLHSRVRYRQYNEPIINQPIYRGVNFYFWLNNVTRFCLEYYTFLWIVTPKNIELIMKIIVPVMMRMMMVTMTTTTAMITMTVIKISTVWTVTNSVTNKSTHGQYYMRSSKSQELKIQVISYHTDLQITIFHQIGIVYWKCITIRKLLENNRKCRCLKIYGSIHFMQSPLVLLKFSVVCRANHVIDIHRQWSVSCTRVQI